MAKSTRNDLKYDTMYVYQTYDHARAEKCTSIKLRATIPFLKVKTKSCAIWHDPRAG